MSIERVSEPEIEPITLAQMKVAIREYIDLTLQDDEIEAWIASARRWLEEHTCRTLIDTTYRLTIRDFEPADRSVTGGPMPLPQDGILLPRSPVLEIVSVATVDSAGDETELEAEDYDLLDAGSKWPRVTGLTAASAVRITFRAGYADQTSSPQTGADVVPAVFKQAMKLWVQAHHDKDKDMMDKLITAACNLVKYENANLQLA